MTLTILESFSIFLCAQETQDSPVRPPSRHRTRPSSPEQTPRPFHEASVDVMTVETLTNWKDPAWIIAGKIRYFDWAILTIAIYVYVYQRVYENGWNLKPVKAVFGINELITTQLSTTALQAWHGSWWPCPSKNSKSGFWRIELCLEIAAKQGTGSLRATFRPFLFANKKGIIEGYIARLVSGLKGPSLITCLRSLSWPVWFLSAWNDPNGVNGVNAWLYGVIPLLRR